MSASPDSGAGFVPVAALATTIAVVQPTSAAPFANELLLDTGQIDGGNLVGTRDFTLPFSSVGSNAIAAVQNFNTGEGDLRFGLDPVSSRFLNASYPGVDGETADQHRHFVTVRAIFNDTPIAQAPEPDSLALVALGRLRASARRRRLLPRDA